MSRILLRTKLLWSWFGFIGHEDPACGMCLLGSAFKQPLRNHIPVCVEGEMELWRRNPPLGPAPPLRPRRSVFVDPKDPDSVELRQFGDQDAHEGDGVDDEVYPVVLGVKAG